MTGRARAKVFGFLAAAIAIAAAPALAQTPEGVSPGAVDRITDVEGRCPTFIWGGVSGAQAYELVVYRLPEEPQATAAAEIDLSATDEVLYAKVPGGATAWQPELADGLEPGGSYVWFVRAVIREEAEEIVEAGDWSAARFFSIPAMPSPIEVEEALSVLRRFANQDGARAAELDQPASKTRSSGSERSALRLSSAPSPESLKSVPTATAAIKGTIPDATGETYGVVGISSSPDGAGVAAANTAGGPDLVLDGSEDLLADAELSESGIDRPSSSPQSFSFSNSGGGGMTLTVDGGEVTTTESELDADNLTSGTVPDGRLAGPYSQALSLTNPANDFTGSGAGLAGVDADTLDGTDSAAFATDLEAAALVAVHAASADHDGRYYTETELNTSGAGGAVNWANLTAVPSGFADGIDNDTVYTMGPGLIVDNGEIRVDPTAFSTRLTYVDGPDSVGDYSSVAIGADGLALISYFDSTNSALKVAHCIDIVCSSATISIPDSAGDVGRYTSIAIGADGLGLISYGYNTNHNLKVAHCNDIACTSATTPTLDSTGDVGEYTSIAIGADGLGLISYFDDTNSALKVAHCNDTSCSSATTHTVDGSSNSGRYTSIAIGADGLGIIAYESGSADLKIAHCDNVECSSASFTDYITFNEMDGIEISLAIGIDDLGLISHFNFGKGEYTIVHCRNPECSSADTAPLRVGSGGSPDSSVAIGVDGLGLISCFDSQRQDLAVVHLGIGVP